MWFRTPRGSWSRNEGSKMSDSNDDYREVLEGGTLQVGDSVVAYTYPLTEGIIINRREMEDGRLELSLIIAPHKKKGKEWSRSKVTVRDAARLSKKPPGKFLFPLKNVESLRVEAKRAKADPVWITQVKAALDKDFAQGVFSSEDSESERKGEEGAEDYELEHSENEQQKSGENCALAKKNAMLEKRLEDIEKLRGINEKGKKRKEEESDESDYEAWRKWRRARRKRKGKKKKERKASSTSSSNSSSSSSSSSSAEDKPKKGEVREKGASGLYSCPFNKFDSRGFSDVKCQVQGQTTTRRHIRMALHNLYAHSQTLCGFADKLVSKAYASAYRPFTMDVAWFQAYAELLDTMLLNSLGGPWALWNEPVVDLVLTGFLELMIRISPSKNYPPCLDDAVRKWMKKKRIGTDSKFGPVPYSMQHAKFTEAGVVQQQSNQARNRERGVGGAKQNNNNISRATTYTAPSGEKRAPPPS